ncbi:Glyco-tran-10-N domain-containing protein [Aphelenchoides besseyi]|nr:Glyco-tran-10-N domain-containing protein [Aphelenchoides besseyi]
MLILIPRLLRPNGKVPDFNLEINPNCEHKCFYTIDGFLLPIADGVFVQPNAIDWKGPKRYSPKQKFFAYLREAPGHYNSLRFKSPSYQFNYTVGFVPGCDIEAGYDKIPPKGVAYFGRTQQPNLTLYGKCYNNNGVKCPNEKCIIPNIRSHRFYFAFENSICKNYVTEKFFRIKQLIVPVVLRRSDYRHLLPDDAFISVDDFE